MLLQFTHPPPERSCGLMVTAGPVLTWQERLSVALDAASALSHLHHHSPHVYHRDIKTANILLDRHNNAKVNVSASVWASHGLQSVTVSGPVVPIVRILCCRACTWIPAPSAQFPVPLPR